MLESIHRSYVSCNDAFPRFTGRTMGCGCCSSDVPIDVRRIDNHIAALKRRLEEAQSVRDEIVENGAFFENEEDFDKYVEETDDD